jgi:hypothetical protein
MRQTGQALVGPADRWAVFFEKLGYGTACRPHAHGKPFFIPDLSLYCMLTPKEPRYSVRTEARELAVKNGCKFVFLVGSPSNASMRNMLFIPPQTPDELDRYKHPARVYLGWYLGNFAGGGDSPVAFNRVGHDLLTLGKPSAGPVFDAFLASMRAFRE